MVLNVSPFLVEKSFNSRVLADLAAFHVSRSREVLANVSGAVSVACWVTILLPQLLEQWRLKSADGVAIGFLLAWLFGDLANLGGAIIGQLRPSVILLAMWFCFSDALLVVSFYYYKHRAAQRSVSADFDPEFASSASVLPPHSPGSTPFSPKTSRNAAAPNLPATSSTPLLQETRDEESVLEPVLATPTRRSNWLLSTGLPAVFVIVVATLTYFVSGSEDPNAPPNVVKSTTAEILGYFSAFLYLAARIPQMLQNHRRRSVEGLSMGFFALSVLGNLTYAGQVVVYRTDREWMQTYIPWLLGSLGTIVEDLIILAQFYVYRQHC